MNKANNKRRKKGEGSIYFEKGRGKWIATVVVEGKKKVFRAPTMEEANDLRSEFITDYKKAKKQGRRLADLEDTRTINDFADIYFKYREAMSNVSVKTLDEYKNKYIWHIKDKLGDKEARTITEEVIEKHVMDLIENGVGAYTIRKAINVLKSILDRVVKAKLIPSNPITKDIELPKHKKKETKAMDSKELEQFLEVARKNKHYSFFHLLLNTGMRVGEAMALVWDDFNFETGEVTLSKTYDNKYGLKEGTKNGESRTLKLNESTVQIMKEHKAFQEMGNLVDTIENKSNVVFQDANGNHLYLPSVRRRHFNEIIKEVIDSKTHKPIELTIHGLRHTFASLSLQNGVPLVEVSGYLGHMNTRITAEIYAHYLPTESTNTASAIEQIIKSK